MLFWLDSSLPRSPDGRFSVLGDASGSVSRIVTADVWAQQVTVESATGVEFVEEAFSTGAALTSRPTPLTPSICRSTLPSGGWATSVMSSRLNAAASGSIARVTPTR